MIFDVHGLTVSLQTEMDRWHVVLLVLLLTSDHGRSMQKLLVFGTDVFSTEEVSFTCFWKLLLQNADRKR